MLGRLDLLLASALIVVCLAVGGGSGSLPAGPMAAELLGLLLLARLLLKADRAPLWGSNRPELLLLLAVAAVPLLQLIPLPPDLWRALPGRGPAAAIAELTGTGGRWRPISLDPEATLSAALALIPFAALLLAALAATAREKRLLLMLVVGLAVVSGMVGGLQWLGRVGTLFWEVDPGYQLGLFVNRNHEAALILVALCLVAGLIASQRPKPGPVLLALGTSAFLILSLLLTESRTGFALLFVGAIGIAFFVVGTTRLPRQARWFMALAPFALLLWLFSPNSGIARLIGRFGAADELRPQIWSTSLDTLAGFAPVGSGLGTFNLVYEQSERLVELTPAWIPHAHNDFLELLLETGLVGAVLIVLFLILFVRRLVRLKDVPGAALERAAGLAGLLLLFHSAVDYPLRNTALLAVFGLLLGTLFHKAEVHASDARPVSSAAGRVFGLTPAGLVTFVDLPRLSRALALCAAFLFLGLLAVSDGLLMTAIERGRFDTALRINRSSPFANGYAAEAVFEEGRFALAETRARQALLPAPAYPRALRALGFARELERDTGGAARALALAGRLGWRDIPTQSWLMLAALERRDWAGAALRGDAVARQGFGEEVFGRFAQMLENPAARAQLAARLRAAPPWRGEFIAHLARLPEARLPLADALLADLASGGRRLATGEIEPYLERLAATGRLGLARQLWRASAGRAPALDAGTLYDGGFSAPQPPLDTYVPPFEWRFASGLGAQAWLSPAPSGRGGPALRVESNGHSSERLVWQALILPPGRYRLSLSALGETTGPAASVEWRVTCPPAGSVLAAFAPRPKPGVWARGAVDFAVPAGCGWQELELRARLEDPPVQTIAWFDGLAIERR